MPAGPKAVTLKLEVESAVPLSSVVEEGITRLLSNSRVAAVR
jgi:hypothetical protein